MYSQFPTCIFGFQKYTGSKYTVTKYVYACALVAFCHCAPFLPYNASHTSFNESDISNITHTVSHPPIVKKELEWLGTLGLVPLLFLVYTIKKHFYKSTFSVEKVDSVKHIRERPEGSVSFQP
jgi:hypothetical protein